MFVKVLSLKMRRKVVGLAQVRAMPSPSRAAEVGFLDNLFVDPSQRGSGAGEVLLREIDNTAALQGCAVVR